MATNYRGIAVGNTIYKLMATIVNNRLKEYVEQHNILPDTQNGFRSGRSTIDNISILNHCIEKSFGSGKKLYAMFIDFKTAFDNVVRPLLFETLAKLNIPSYLISVIEGMYKTATYMVGDITFESHRGLKEGCPLSPLVFALYISKLEDRLRANQLGGVMVGNQKVFGLAFADDIVIMAQSSGELKHIIREVHRFAVGRKLEVNVEKTKIVMFSKGSRSSREDWTTDSKAYEEVEDFNYLGVTFQWNGNFTRHHQEVLR